MAILGTTGFRQIGHGGAAHAAAAVAHPPHVELTWKPSTSDVMGYNVYRADAPKGEMQLLNATPIPEPCYEDRTVKRGHTYYYEVRAVAVDGGLSAPSNEATAPIK
ncbi:MAG: hypothetical protein ACRD2E_04725 [Terriglobales bacterium]